ncbi:hypothetical protein LCGC14_2391850, partial [marine sediment metagenome]
IQKQTDGTLDIVVYGPLSPQQKVGVEQAVRDAKTITQPSSKRYLLEDEARELGYAIERVAVESERMSPLQTGPLKNEYWSIADPSQVKTIPKWQGHQIVVDTTPDGITRLNVTSPSEKFNARIASPEDIGPADRVTAANVRAKLDEFDQVVGPGTFPGPEAEGVVFKKPTEIGRIEEAVPSRVVSGEIVLGPEIERRILSQGVTQDVNEAGWILRDGRLVRGLGGHKEIVGRLPSSIQAGLRDKVTRAEAIVTKPGDEAAHILEAASEEMGAIRIQVHELYEVGAGVDREIFINAPITDAQLQQIMKLVDSHESIFIETRSLGRTGLFEVVDNPNELRAALNDSNAYLGFRDAEPELPLLAVEELDELDKLQGIKGKLSNKQTARLSELEAKAVPPEPPAPNPFEIGGFSRAPQQMQGPRFVGGGPAPDDIGGFSRGGGGGRIGGGGVVEGGPPFEGSEGEEAIAKLTQLINQAQKPRRGQTLLQHEELQRRFKVVSERLRTGEGTPEEIAARAKAALGGPQPKAQFEPVRPFMTESE